MSSTVLFGVMALLAALLLFILNIITAVGASQCYSSTYYNTDNNIKNAHDNFTIATALGWSSFAIIIVSLAVGLWAGGYSTVEISKQLLSKKSFDEEETEEISKATRELMRSKTTQTIILIIFIIMTIVIFIVGVFAILAAVQLQNAKQDDLPAKSAYTSAIVSSLLSVGVIGLAVVAIVAYVGVKRAHNKNLKEAEDLEEKIKDDPEYKIVDSDSSTDSDSKTSVSKTLVYKSKGSKTRKSTSRVSKTQD